MSGLMCPDAGTGALPSLDNNAPSTPQQPPNSSTGSLSQLSDASYSVGTSITSQLGSEDIGLPLSPARRVLSECHEDLYDTGYDSEGQRAPWLESNPIENEAEDAQEATLPGENDELVEVDVVFPIEPSGLLTVDAMEGMKVLELKKALKDRGIDSKGNKSVLKERLKAAIEAGTPLLDELSPEVAANIAGDEFDPGSYWKLLEPDGEIVEDVLDIRGERFRAPTSPEGEVSTTVKQSYDEVFDRPPFTGTTKLPKRWRNGRIAKTTSGEVIRENYAHEETVPSLDFCDKHHLDLDSHPVEWFQAFVPKKNKRHTTASRFTMENVLSWTNTKARMNNAGLGGKYHDYYDFTLDELMRHIGLYLYHGLSPSPQIEMKFHSSLVDPVNGRDFIHKAFGSLATKSIRRHKHFKCFFSSVDPTIQTPSRDSHPNWKVHPLLKHMLKVSQAAVFMGKNLSCDEQTVGFQGNHRDKQRITYKKEGDGFLADCICSNGYTYAFHFRHQKASEALIKEMKCSPLHSRVLGLISQLPHKNYTLGMDNLYMSAKFARLCMMMPQRVHIHGVTRPSMRGVPEVVKQKEVTSKVELAKVRNTVKVAILKGDSVCQNLICVSLYDSKPVYLLTNACGEVKWIRKIRKVYSTKHQRYTTICFHRLNVINFYNYNMGNVDIADQLRNTYRYDTQWHRNRKWWWAIWWWGFQTLLTNSYILYVSYHKLHDSETYATHYDYIKMISLAWIDQEGYWPEPKKKKRSLEPIEEGIIINERQSRARREGQTSPMSEMSEMTQNTRRAARIITAATPSTNTGRKRSNTSVTDISVHPTKGTLMCRLTTNCQHIPAKSRSRRPRCQLHRWARGRDGVAVMNQIISCSLCNVDLCVPCFGLFHKEPNLLDMKEAIASSGK